MNLMILYFILMLWAGFATNNNLYKNILDIEQKENK